MATAEAQALWRFDEQQGYCLLGPSRWQGDSNCVVGPFSSQEVAHYFATVVVGAYEGLQAQEIFALRDAWYVKVMPSAYSGSNSLAC